MDIQSIRPGKKVNVGMKCLKYMLIVMSVAYLIISCLMISGATTFKVLLGPYSSIFWYDDTINNLPSLWIATGCFLMAFSIFGIAAAVKESTMMTNLFGILLSLVFILQIAAAITGFTLISRTNGLINISLNNLMDRYDYDYKYKTTMDWIQRSFSCCGNDGPSDWQIHGTYEYRRTTSRDWRNVTNDYWYTTTSTPFSTSTPVDWDYETDNPHTYDYVDYDDKPRQAHDAKLHTTSTTTTKSSKLDTITPESCCTRQSSTYINYTCEHHFDRGCHSILYPMVSSSVMMIGTSALVIGVVQIFGIVCAFVLSRTLRRDKTQRDIQKWTIHQSMGFDRPAYIDEIPTQNSQTGEVKQV